MIVDLNSPKGVRSSQEDLNTVCKKYKIIYCSGKKPLGVRKHNTIVYYQRRKKTVNMLYCNRSCVCGSLTHSRTSHKNCPLNVRYIL